MWKLMKRVGKTLVDALGGPDVSQDYAFKGKTTRGQWDSVPVLKRQTMWMPDGRLFVVEHKRCPMTGLKVSIQREVRG